MYGVIEKNNEGSKYNTRYFFIPLLIVLSFLTSKSCYADNIPIGWFWGINSAFTGCLLMYLGRILKLAFDKYCHSLKKRWVMLVIGIGLVLLGMIITIPNLNNEVNIALASYGIYPLFYLTVFIMAAGVLMLAKAIDNPFSSHFGKYTLPIYAFHLLIMGVVTIVLQKVGLAFSDVIVQGFMVSVLTLLATSLLVKPLQKYVPNLVGEFK